MTTTTTEARLDRAQADYLIAQDNVRRAVTRRWDAWQEIHRDCAHGEVALACRVQGCTQRDRYVEADDALHRSRLAHDTAQVEWLDCFRQWVEATIPA